MDFDCCLTANCPRCCSTDMSGATSPGTVGTQGMGNVQGHPGAGGLMFLKDGENVAFVLGNPSYRQEVAVGQAQEHLNPKAELCTTI